MSNAHTGRQADLIKAMEHQRVSESHHRPSKGSCCICKGHLHCTRTILAPMSHANNAVEQYSRLGPPAPQFNADKPVWQITCSRRGRRCSNGFRTGPCAVAWHQTVPCALLLSGDTPRCEGASTHLRHNKSQTSSSAIFSSCRGPSGV